VNSRVDDTNASYAYGGAGRDVLIGNSPNDRLIDWTGEYNNYYVPSNPYGLGTVTRDSSPGLIDFLLQMAASDGADLTAGLARGGDPARYGEPYGELGLVINQDAESGDQKGAPRSPNPGNKSDGGGGGKKSTTTTETETSFALLTESDYAVLEEGNVVDGNNTGSIHVDETDVVVTYQVSSNEYNSEGNPDVNVEDTGTTADDGESMGDAGSDTDSVQEPEPVAVIQDKKLLKKMAKAA
jgi:hypothetical protein